MVGSAAIADRFATTRRDERVTYILREPETRHRFGISSLALGEDALYTAGRDGTVRAWRVPSSYRPLGTADLTVAPEPLVAKHLNTFDEHVDWVNDVVLVHGFERLVSCSSDTTVKVWNAANSASSLRTLVEHTDYVKALAQVPNGVASGSLDGRVLVWDLVTGSMRLECGADTEDGPVRNGSVYCMAGCIDSNTLVSGSTDKTISVWDLRTGDRVVHLRGHSDSVRCLTMKRDALCMLSGGTDSTVKLWDLRQERCVRSFDSSGDGSVWAVAANERFDSFVSGGRDGSVWYTDMATDDPKPILPPAQADLRGSMVLDVALSTCGGGVWVSTTGSTVRLWPLPADAVEQMNGVEESMAPSSPAKNKSVMIDAAPQDNGIVTSGEPLCVIPGLPGIIAHKVMNDRRHVLTCDTQGEYKIWDITQGELTKSLGIIDSEDIEEVAKKNDVEICVPSWFHVDIRLGSLSVRLDKGSAANAEIYAVDAGLDLESEDTKVNIGEHVLRGLFRKWLQENRRREEGGESNVNNHMRSPLSQAQKNAVQRADTLPPYVFPDHVPVIVTEDNSPVPILRRTVGNFKGNEQDLMPGWVVDLVRGGKFQTKEVVKISFTLEPVEGSGLPDLSTTTLNAPRVLRVRKVASYISKELREIRPSLDIEPENLEVLCNGQILSPTMSLATVRQFKWRLPDDLCLQFRPRKNS